MLSDDRRCKKLLLLLKLVAVLTIICVMLSLSAGLLHQLSHFVGLLQSGVSLYLTHVPYAGGEEFSFHYRTVQTVNEAHEIVEHAFQGGASVFSFGSGGDEIESPRRGLDDKIRIFLLIITLFFS